MVADTMTILTDRFRRDEVRHVVDIGCGKGAVAKRLSDLGFAVVGVDPSAAAIDKARQTAPAARFEMAGGEALPFAAGSFDAVLFHNSFHHVPADRMEQALREAARVLRGGGSIMVVEPAAHGPLFETVRPIEDETFVRAAAEGAIGAAVAAGHFALVETLAYERDECFADVEQFLTHLLQVDPTRAAAIDRGRGHVGRLFAANGERGDAGYSFRQPQTLFVLRPV